MASTKVALVISWSVTGPDDSDPYMRPRLRTVEATDHGKGFKANWYPS